VRRRAWVARAMTLCALPVVRAPRAEPQMRIGLLSPTSAAANQARLAVLRAALAELGYEEGRNLLIEYRYAEGRFERLPEMAGELAAAGVSPIIAINTPAAVAAARMPGSTPVLFASVGDPVAIGLVRNLSRPGGKVTGTTNMARDLGKKRMQLLSEMLPSAKRLAVLSNPDDPVTASQEADVRAAAPTLGFAIRFFPVREVSALPDVIKAASEWRADAVLRIAEPLLTQHRALLIRSLLEHRLPAMTVTAPEVREGGLMSYFSVEAEEYRTLAGYVDRILKGASPANLPVQRPTRFDLVINIATARSLGIAVPSALLLRADEVIG
jgi:putative tryptophan/tyrosine transport system substrate-binding protein